MTLLLGSLRERSAIGREESSQLARRGPRFETSHPCEMGLVREPQISGEPSEICLTIGKALEPSLHSELAPISGEGHARRMAE